MSAELRQHWLESERGHKAFEATRSQDGIVERFNMASATSSPMSSWRSTACKVRLVGAAASGKSALSCLLTGRDIQKDLYVPTPGIEVLDTRWPILVENQIVSVKLNFWDIGSDALNEHNFLKESVQDGANVIIFVVDSTNSKSLEFVKSELTKKAAERVPVRCIVMTKVEDFVKRQVPTFELAALAKEMGVKAFMVSCIPGDPWWKRSYVREVLDHISSAITEFSS